MSKDEIFNRMIQISESFNRNSSEEPLFTPEHESTKRINEILGSAEILTVENVNEAINELNSVSEVEHYDGSGWLDFKMHLSAYLKINGFETDWGQKKRMKLK